MGEQLKSCYFLHFWAQCPAGGKTSTSQWGTSMELRLWRRMSYPSSGSEGTDTGLTHWLTQSWRFLHITKDNMKFASHKPHSALGLEEQLKGESENRTQGAKAPVLAKNPRRERLQNLAPGSQKALNQTGQLRLFTWYSPNQFPR